MEHKHHYAQFDKYRSIKAAVETFFKSLKAKMLWRQSRPTRRQATAAIFQYINGFYNPRRRHSYLGNISPSLSRPKPRKKDRIPT
ncbi:hypothetical protein HK13_09910 [Acetobacter indonesiensis]|nr:hypothetical protein HK13_09910 [Acetobacter indonesiensis]